MKSNPKYKIGQVLDTSACGACKIKDVLRSGTTSVVVYAVESDGGVAYYEESELDD